MTRGSRSKLCCVPTRSNGGRRRSLATSVGTDTRTLERYSTTTDLESNRSARLQYSGPNDIGLLSSWWGSDCPIEHGKTLRGDVYRRRLSVCFLQVISESYG